MSWSCPHEANGFCQRRRKTCEPLAKNCALEGKGLVLAAAKTPSGQEKEHLNVKHKGTGINVRIIQHVPFEGIGSISRWLDKRHAAVRYSRLYKNPIMPDLKGVDLLVIMGGPMSVNDESLYPWLKGEKELIRKAIQKDISVLGVCLGAQLIAASLGARVYQNSVKEIGWFPVSATPCARTKLHFPETISTFHWHGETFDLPDGAVRLATSQVCRNQAFMLNEKVIGLQFHLEATQQSVKQMVRHCGNELVEGQFIQSELQILSQKNKIYSGNNDLMDDLLTFLLSFKSKT